MSRSLVLIILRSQHLFLLTRLETMAKQAEPVMARAIRVLGECDASHQLHPSVGLLDLFSEFIGKLNDGFSQPIILKYKTNSLKGKFSSNGGKQGLKLTQRW